MERFHIGDTSGKARFADGEWVRYSDHVAALTADRARIAAAIRSRTPGVHPDVRDLLEDLLRVVEGG
jgi:hypothetical protein